MALTLRPLPLDSLTAPESYAYLERRGVEDSDLRSEIVEAAGGHPLSLSLAADLVAQMGLRSFKAKPQWQLMLHSLVERLLKDIEQPALRSLLEAASIVRQFDEPTLRALCDEEHVDEAFDRICNLSVVRPSEHGLRLHDDVRRILRDDLRWRDKQRYDDLRLRALAHYEARLAEAPADERERLMAELVFLQENAFMQTFIFSEAEPGEYWLDYGRPTDVEEAWQLWEQYATQSHPRARREPRGH